MPTPAGRVLVVDDEDNQRTALASMIQAWGYETAAAANGAEALMALESFDAGAIVTDLMMPVMDGNEFLSRLKEQGNAPPAIVLTAFGNLETAVALVHDLGAFWFLEKPLQPGAMKLLLERALATGGLERYNETLERRLSEQGVLGEMIGAAAAMQETYSLIRQVAPTMATVLLTGESGTGKELAARAIHELSSRRDGPFVAVNCAALPETLIESELFGHEKGAFTGAVERRRGCFELARGGTILLDEIGEMPLSTQAKLLRVLEDRKVRRLGGPGETPVDARVIASTNRNLGEVARQGGFRQDLFFRLNVFHIELPPLRDHKDDLPLLCSAFVSKMNTQHECRVTGINADAFAELEAHDWPGNVRELRNALERAVILAGEGELGPRHFLGLGGSARGAVAPLAADPGTVSVPVGVTLEETQRKLIEATLRHTGNNRTRAAAILGISVKTLFNKLKEYGAAAVEE